MFDQNSPVSIVPTFARSLQVFAFTVLTEYSLKCSIILSFVHNTGERHSGWHLVVQIIWDATSDGRSQFVAMWWYISDQF